MGVCTLIKKEEKEKESNIPKRYVSRKSFTIVQKELLVNKINNERVNLIRSI
jgi:hypothetical protein